MCDLVASGVPCCLDLVLISINCVLVVTGVSRIEGGVASLSLRVERGVMITYRGDLILVDEDEEGAMSSNLNKDLF